MCDQEYTSKSATISKGAYTQVVWERDVAISQLAAIGKGLGEKMDDVAPVVHGKWIDKPSGAYGRWQSWCSVCGERSGIGGIESNRHKPFGPNCGAKMDRGSDNAAN